MGGCSRPRAGRGLCSAHYELHRRRGDLDEVGLAPRSGGARQYDHLCGRCRVQLNALAADRGRGDRPLLAGTMTMAEASAYMLGFLDALSRPRGDAIDPYIVTRFHELRTGTG